MNCIQISKVWRATYFLRSISLLFTLLTTQSCITHYDRLKYYVDGYKPNNISFPCNGFYFSKSDSTVHGGWPNAIQEIYFFKDGSFEFGSNTENIDSLDRWICKYGKKDFFNYGPWGFYMIKNDTLLVEYIVKDAPGFTKALRYDFKGVRVANGIRIFEQNGQRTNQEWLFHANQCVPESTSNWLKRHRKYKLKKVKK